MEKHKMNIKVEDKNVVEIGLFRNVNLQQNSEQGLLYQILNKLSILEDKIKLLEYQTKTHWVN